MKGRDITEQIRQAGYEVALSEDWQRVRCTGPKPLTEAYKDLLKANKHEVLHWLVANAFKDHFDGRIFNLDEASESKEGKQVCRFPTDPPAIGSCAKNMKKATPPWLGVCSHNEFFSAW